MPNPEAAPSGPFRLRDQVAQDLSQGPTQHQSVVSGLLRCLVADKRRHTSKQQGFCNAMGLGPPMHTRIHHEQARRWLLSKHTVGGRQIKAVSCRNEFDHYAIP